MDYMSQGPAPRAEENDVRALKSTILKFSNATGLKNNFDHEKEAALSDLLQCKLENLPMSYLGLPLSIHKLSAGDLQPLVGKLSNCLLRQYKTSINVVGLSSGQGKMFALELNAWPHGMWSAPQKTKLITKIQIGNGACASFWFDRWMGDFSIANRFEALFSHTSDKNVSIKQATKTKQHKIKSMEDSEHSTIVIIKGMHMSKCHVRFGERAFVVSITVLHGHAHNNANLNQQINEPLKLCKQTKKRTKSYLEARN
uniref:Uncharacterized protein n=1 Tax=Oryza meridionalis TaxID=40149 RepID=A0A0E0DJF9_9ORYZ